MRRPSGVYVARLVVPPRHRQVVGKRELIASTGTRVLAVARIVGGEILARWRRQLHDLDVLGSNMNVLQVAAGSPVLLQEGYLPLREAGEVSGIGEEQLLRVASEGRLDLFLRMAGLDGYLVRLDELERDHDGGSNPHIIPVPEQLVAEVQTRAFGAYKLREPHATAALLLQDGTARLLALDVLDTSGTVFVPLRPLHVRRATLEVATLQVDRVRRDLARSITPEQHERATAQEKQDRIAKTAGEKAHHRLSDAVAAYFDDVGASASPDQTRRKRAACDLLVELEGDPRLHELTRDRLKTFQTKKLPTIPENENKVRLQMRTTSVSESIAAVAGTDWKCISPAERHKRMDWICGLFSWLKEEKWLNDDPAQGLNARRRKAKEDAKPAPGKRRPFTPDELRQMFAHVVDDNYLGRPTTTILAG